MIRKIIYILSATIILVPGITLPAAAMPSATFEAQNIPFYDPDAPKPCIPGQSTDTGQTTIGPEVEIGVGTYGGTWDGEKLQEDDDSNNDSSILGDHGGTTMFAELSSLGSKDYAQLAKMLNPPAKHLGWTSEKGSAGFKARSKFKLTHNGKSIIVEKRAIAEADNPVKGRERAISVGYEAAKLIDFKEGTAVMKIQQVADDTPVTPLKGAPISNTTTEDTPLTSPSGDSTGARTFSFLLGKGLSRNQALGILGNFMQETADGSLDLKPEAENSIGAFGIAQWYRGNRTNLQTFAKENGTTEKDFTTQLNFLWKDLNTRMKDSVLTPLLASTTIEESTRIFLEKYEVPCVPGKDGKGCDKEFAIRFGFAEDAVGLLAGVAGSSTDTVNTCEGEATSTDGTTGGPVNADGYANPVKDYTPTKLHLTCTKTGGGGSQACHPGDRTGAFDIIAPPGRPVLAITNGTIQSVRPYLVGTAKNDSKCKSVQFQGDDGWTYWYGHTYINHPAGKRFKAGEVMGVVGSLACGLGGAAHLHIDRGFPKGRGGGEDAHRDDAFIPLMQQIFKGVSQKATAV